MNNGNTQAGVSRERQANRLQTCRMSRTSTCSTVKCSHCWHSHVAKPSTSPSTERAMLKQMSEKLLPKLPATATSGAPTQQAQSQPLSHLPRTGIDRDVMKSPDPKNNLSHPKTYEIAKEIKRQLVQHGYYAFITNCRTKVPRYFEKYLEFYAEFQNFISVFKDFSMNP